VIEALNKKGINLLDIREEAKKDKKDYLYNDCKPYKSTKKVLNNKEI